MSVVPLDNSDMSNRDSDCFPFSSNWLVRLRLVD